MISIATIDAGNRLRVLDPAWVRTIADDMAVEGQQEPIHIVERGDRFRLVSGARRLAAAGLLGWAEIEAKVKPASALADDASATLAEIKADMMRGELTVLDRARYIAAWREVYETVHVPPKRGRKPATAPTETTDELIANFANNFTDAAKAALGLSQRSIYLALQVASIAPELTTQIALHPVAGKQSELLTLASQSEARQAAIVDMLVSEPVRATSVTEALMLLGTTPSVAKLAAYERIHEKFSTLKPAEKVAFFELNAPDIEIWLAERANTKRSKAA